MKTIYQSNLDNYHHVVESFYQRLDCINTGTVVEHRRRPGMNLETISTSRAFIGALDDGLLIDLIKSILGFSFLGLTFQQEGGVEYYNNCVVSARIGGPLSNPGNPNEVDIILRYVADGIHKYKLDLLNPCKSCRHFLNNQTCGAREPCAVTTSYNPYDGNPAKNLWTLKLRVKDYCENEERQIKVKFGYNKSQTFIFDVSATYNSGTHMWVLKSKRSPLNEEITISSPSKEDAFSRFEIVLNAIYDDYRDV